MRLKILSYNIHKGFTTWNRDFVLGRIRAALRETDADVLFLQEVLGEHRGMVKHLSDSETRIQFEYLADSVWTHFAYGKNAIYADGDHGNAILSKYPILSWSNQTISDDKRELRGLLKARIQTGPGQEIVLANTHLDLTQNGRDSQTEVVINDLKQETVPWVLVGDFNDWNKKVSPVIEEKLQAVEAFKFLHGKYPPTFPSFLPLLSLDRVFIYQMKPVLAEALKDATWKRLSDHLPLYVEVDLEEAA
ncbi:endonuclease/exonuclease/phosphatase family protein [Peredibacter starrii]|uniref:Endonuclease/exonuclease/phosphatase family protein n=1 Tax=Peredibacter starrii TaxID=28202 RepID=A0AAX4HP49_9BACT|nr:endonuclease/exonuclease/phosphatase family protein [Peredibacter starrii]WPU65113.1 endonuclease/exonuclease/phosphatase family protein [Peredibacter starrii]